MPSVRVDGIDPSSQRLISLEEAKAATRLDLVAARDIVSDEGRSLHDLESDSESESHRLARAAAIGFFRSIGYHIFPEGIGVRGVYTLADFLALRNNRTVFVEVLSDSNIRQETLGRKAQLQPHGELCFVVYSGTKSAAHPDLLVAKRAIQSWADVLYCSLNKWSGIEIKRAFHASVSYDTTRSSGIRISLAFERFSRKVAVALRFQTHLYENVLNTPLSHVVLPISYCYEQMWLEVFGVLAKTSNCTIKLRFGQQHVTAFRAMRRKSGLKMVRSDGRTVGYLKSEYRGPVTVNPRAWDFHPQTRDLPPDDVYGVFVLERTGPDVLRNLIQTLLEYGLTPEYDSIELEKCLELLDHQCVNKNASDGGANGER